MVPARNRCPLRYPRIAWPSGDVGSSSLPPRSRGRRWRVVGEERQSLLAPGVWKPHVVEGCADRQRRLETVRRVPLPRNHARRRCPAERADVRPWLSACASPTPCAPLQEQARPPALRTVRRARRGFRAAKTPAIRGYRVPSSAAQDGRRPPVHGIRRALTSSLRDEGPRNSSWLRGSRRSRYSSGAAPSLERVIRKVCRSSLERGMAAGGERAERT